ncbi:MGMT family protein [Intrasporangium sp.]|uniref:MGMT family protein n=1 Tax=Intrasporangium sp. TaxID=1925024 RepID=UPI003221E500
MTLEEYAERVLDLVAQIPSGQVVAYGDIARMIGHGGPRNVGAVMSRYGSDVPWWRVIRADGRPPRCHDGEAIEHWRAEGTPMVGGRVTGARVDMSRARWAGPAASRTRGAIHHVEIWVDDVAVDGAAWDWLLGRLGYRLGDDWGQGRAWELDSHYVVVESGPDLAPGGHERRRAGVNHLAFHAGSPADVDALVADAPAHGWSVLFADAHPHAGGPDHYAAYLESPGGFEVELVAT